jgi:hypothetical protein
MYASNCSGQGSDTNSLLMTNSAATSGGYTSSQTYVFSPTSSGSPTAGSGANKSSFCSSLATASVTDAYLTDAATACASDTRYACTYNTLTHTLTCPARTVVARPASAAWDVGAYQFSTSSAPQAPGSLQATPH